MAEEHKKWRQKHSHESSTVRYGTFGTATYLEDSQEWNFLRNTPSTILGSSEDYSTPARDHRIHILGDPIILADSIDNSASQERCESTRGLPSELKSALSFSEDFRPPPDSDSVLGSRFSIGNAVWLGSDGIDSGNLTVPVSAYVHGNGHDVFHLVCVSRQATPPSFNQDFQHDTHMPSLIGGRSTFWSNTQPILQLAFSSTNESGSNGTFLAVRQSCGTTFFQPLLRRDDPSVGRDSAIDVNPLLTIRTHSTDSYCHADVAFSIYDQSKIAIVDVKGNWSVWQIRGRRTDSVKVDYKAELITSGHPTVSNNTQIFNDGFDQWHRIAWISRVEKNSALLLVCGRFEATLFSESGSKIFRLDLRLDTGKTRSQLLDLKISKRRNFCFMLTSRRLLAFDFATADWKGVEGPTLLATWLHDYDAHDLSLQLTVLEIDGTTLLGIHSSRSPSIRFFSMAIGVDTGADAILTSYVRPFELESSFHHAPLSFVSLLRCESTTYKHKPDCELLQVILQYDDMSLLSIPASCSVPDRAGGEEEFDLILPPQRSMQVRSERRIDMAEDSELIDLVLSTREDAVLKIRPWINAGQKDNAEDRMLHLVAKDFGDVSTYCLQNHAEYKDHSQEQIIDGLIDMLETNANNLTRLMKNGSAVLSDAIRGYSTIEDVGATSDHLERLLNMISSANKTSLMSYTFTQEQPANLVHNYDRLFKLLVENLSTGIPNRTRMYRERLVRTIACEKYLSSYVVQIKRDYSIPQADRNTADLEFQVLSDPIGLDDHFEPDEVIKTSASQLEHNRTSSDHPVPPTASHLQGAIERLSTYATIHERSPEGLFHDDAACRYVEGILDHIPEDPFLQPEEYSWAEAEMRSSSEKKRERGADVNAAERKRSKIARARERSRNLSSGPGLRRLRSEELGDESAVLPIRSSAESSRLKYPSTANEGLNSYGINLSTANTTFSQNDTRRPADSQSNDANALMSATQPVRGAYGSRVNAEAKSQVRKRRKAGF